MLNHYYNYSEWRVKEVGASEFPDCALSTATPLTTEHCNL